MFALSFMMVKRLTFLLEFFFLLHDRVIEFLLESITILVTEVYDTQLVTRVL